MQTITQDLAIQGSQASGTVTVPAGEDRTFAVQAKDSQGTVLATGSTTRDLEPGSSPAIQIELVITIGLTVDLVYDDGDPHGGYYWTSWGSAFGVEMTSPQYPATVQEISYYIRTIQGNGSGDGSFTAYVVDLEGQSGTLLTPPIPVTPSATGWVAVDVSSYNVQVQEDFVVAMFYDGVNTPSLGYDQEDNGRARDCYYSSQQDEYIWLDWEETYFIRASVTLPTGETVELGQVRD
jgi:hypothetical protein